MGAAISSVDVADLAAKSHSPNVEAVLETARTINEQTLEKFTLITQREFHLDVKKLQTLFPNLPTEIVEQTFAVFDVKNNGVVDSCELLASLVLVAPHFSREIKQKGICARFYARPELT